MFDEHNAVRNWFYYPLRRCSLSVHFRRRFDLSQAECKEGFWRCYKHDAVMPGALTARVRAVLPVSAEGVNRLHRPDLWAFANANVTH